MRSALPINFLSLNFVPFFKVRQLVILFVQCHTQYIICTNITLIACVYMLILLWVLISVWLGEFEELANGPGVLYYLQEEFVSQKELHMHVTILDDNYIITYKLMAMPYILVPNYNLVGKDNMFFTSTGGIYWNKAMNDWKLYKL